MGFLLQTQNYDPLQLMFSTWIGPTLTVIFSLEIDTWIDGRNALTNLYIISLWFEINSWNINLHIL